MADAPDLPEQLTGVGATALGVALMRAEESRRTDRLFDDPYAQYFLDTARHGGSPWSGLPASGRPLFLQAMAGQVAVRTRFLDDVLLGATQRGVCNQVVLLACGMDTRAFRLDWPAETSIFELDFAEVLKYRSAVLTRLGASAACCRIEVATDLRQDWPSALGRAGFDGQRPTAWLAEGILYALPPEGADLLLDLITASSAPGSVLVLDHIEDSGLLRNARTEISPALNQLWQGGPTESLHDWLSKYGWRPVVHDIIEVAARYQRPTPLAFDHTRDDTAHGWLATAYIDKNTDSGLRGIDPPEA